jgi:hypothetical protein
MIDGAEKTYRRACSPKAGAWITVETETSTMEKGDKSSSAVVVVNV